MPGWPGRCSVITETQSYQTGRGRLRELLATLKPGIKAYEDIIAPRDRVLARYGTVFAAANLENLTAEEFKTFLYFENNRHWTGLYRKGWRACEDMPNLRRALALLLDETGPVTKRLDKAIDMVPGMGRALATAILLVTNPTTYGVWNNTSEEAMRQLSLWPTFSRGDSFGEKYVKVNEVLLRIVQDLSTDLWTLDSLWWVHLGGLDDVTPPPVPPVDQGVEPAGLPPASERFILERHLEEFLVGNWERLELGKDWALFQSEGQDEPGNQYPTGIGRIDILAKHKVEPRWLVIELKRNQSSDETVGQVTRYMGWVKRHLAKPGDRVEGLIIAHQAESAVHYALTAVPDVGLQLYEVQFRLHKPHGST
jgi:hypothetical protein